MKRDMDLVRDLLLKIEEQKNPALKNVLPNNASNDDYDRTAEHLRMLIEEAGLVTGIPAHMMGGKNWLDLKLTWAGHDFLDAVRDPEIWSRTKKGAAEVKGFTFDLLKDLAKGFIKTQIKERTGVDI